jgi:hypothetical protein
MPREIHLAGRVLLNYILYFFKLRRLNLEKVCDSIVKLFSDSLKFKRLLSSLVFVTLIKMVLKRRPFGASLTLFQVVWNNFEKGTPWSLLFCFSRLSKRQKITELTFTGLVKIYMEGVLMCHA